jgi:PST family polysaccharide transporter
MQYGQAIANFIILRILSRWRPGKLKRGTGVRDMFAFGINITWYNLFNFFSRNLDNFLIGRFIGKAELGQYAMSYRLMMLPIMQINSPLGAVLGPSLCRAQNDQTRFEALYFSFVKGLAWFTLPCIALGAVLGKHLIPLLLGDQWGQAADLFGWLAIASLFQPVCNISGAQFIARGRTDMMFRWGVFSSIVNSTGFLIGVQFGVQGVAMAYAISSMLLVFPCLFYSCKAGSVPFSRLLRIICPATLLSTIILLGAHQLERALQ